jgi:hypothetical protein
VLRARHAGSFCEGLQGNREVSAVRSCRCEELKSKNLAVRLHVESQQSRCCLFNYMYALIVASAPPQALTPGGCARKWLCGSLTQQKRLAVSRLHIFSILLLAIIFDALAISCGVHDELPSFVGNWKPPRVPP